MNGSSAAHLGINNNNNQSPVFDYNAKMMHSISHSLIGSNSGGSGGGHLIAGQHHLSSPINGANTMGGFPQPPHQGGQTTSPHIPLATNTTATPQNFATSTNNPMKQESSSPLSNSLLTTAQQLHGSDSPNAGAGSIPTLPGASQLSSGGSSSAGIQGSAAGSSQATPVNEVTVAGSNTPLTTGGSSLGVTDHQQFENDKKVIFNHPLFPLLQLLFDKCETATNSAECPSSASFDLDIENFIHLHERDRKPFYTDNADVNDVMIRAIQVLRIHLLELEKVNELCKDFCQRYIACLKNKMQSDTLLGCGAGGGPGALSPTSGLHHQYPLSDSPNTQLQLNCGGPVVNVSHPNAALSAVVTPGAGGALGPHHPNAPPNGHNTAAAASSAAAAASMHAALYPQLSMFPGMAAAAAAASTFPGYHSPQGHAPPGTPHGGPHSHGALHNGAAMLSGSTPISQVGLQHPGGVNGGGPPGVSPLHHHAHPGHPHHPHHLLGPHGGHELNPDGSFKKTKRGVLPKHATQIMRQWLFQHIVHPYPTEDEKRQIAVQTNLTLLQVNNWFINARRRILQPMLEASNPESVSKSKKNKNNRPTAVNRFWPDNLAQGQITNNFKSSNSDDCESPPPGGQHVNSSGGEGGNSTNNNNVSPSNRSGSTPQDGMLLNGSRENAMNNLQLLNSPSALSDCSDDRSSNEVGMSPPTVGVLNGGPVVQSTGGVVAGGGGGGGGSFLTNGYDAYSNSSASQSQAASLFAAQTSAI